jgi:hypothetical protein
MRASVGFFNNVNNEADIDAMLDVMKGCAGRSTRTTP